MPVILNLQTTEGELAKRLIDFASGLTYALDGGMQKIAEKTFLLTPRNVEVSAEEKARLVEKGFFNQSAESPLRRGGSIGCRHDVGFAGAGNMAAAMARGWARPSDGPEPMLFCDAGSGRAAALAERGRRRGRRLAGRARRCAATWSCWR